MNKSFVAAAAAFMLLSGAASGADLPVKSPVFQAAPIKLYDWSGFYAGGHAGWASGKVGWTVATPFMPSADIDNRFDGFVGGLQAGYQRQQNNVVFGVEASWSDGNLSSGADQISFANDTRSGEARVQSLVTATGRLGFAYNNWLLYGKGGFAAARVTTTLRDVSGGLGNGVAISSGEAWQSGWVAGAGLDYGLTDKIVLGAEANWIDLQQTTIANATLGSAAAIDHQTIAPRLFTVLARVSFKFGGP